MDNPDLREIIAALERIDAKSTEASGVGMVLELRKSAPPLNETVLFGDRAGLIHLGLLCLSLAADERRGAHYQFDGTSVFRHLDSDLVIARALVEPSTTGDVAQRT